MNQIANYVWIAVIPGMLIVTSSPVYAQDVPTTNVSFGYQWQHISICLGVNCKDNLPAGWYLDVSGGISRMFGWVGQVDGAYKTGAFEIVKGNDIGFNIHTYSGGVRIIGTSMVAPFAQFLVGGARRVFSDPRNPDADVLNAFVIDIGGGVNFLGRARWGERIGVDYRRGFFEEARGGATDAVRINVGAVVSLSP